MNDWQEKIAQDAFVDELKKFASKKLSKRLMSMSLESLKKLSPEAAAARVSKKVPIYLTETGAMQPSLKGHVAHIVREGLKPKRKNVLGVLREVPGQGDLLAKKNPGEVLAKLLKRKEIESYW